MYLFFDTETTGLPLSWNAPISDVNNWPRLVQLAWLLYDESGMKLDEGNNIIKPEGFVIPHDSAIVHGISQKRALEEGVPLQGVLENFAGAVDASDILVAHNMRYDESIIGAEFLRLKMPNRLFDKPRICTMREATEFCRIPGPYGFKWPTLTELYYCLFRSLSEEAHNASVDAAVCAKCFFKLKKMGIISV
ncbi:MAG: 3'-5' exonuclease [Candidatus Aminicenantes bacterium]|nr:3'-5' exonuclease [Candidatus Aminicenantes bacterium]